MDNEDEPKDSAVNRRAFIAGAATGAAVVLAQQASIAGAQEAVKPVIDPGMQANTRPASDYMVDIFKSFGMEYMFSMCASSFIGIHESVLNYAGNKNPAGDRVHARRDLGGHGERLREDRGQAGARVRARHRGRAARGDGGVRRMVRPRARLPRARQHERRRAAQRRRVLGAQRAGSGGARARHHEVGRQPGVDHALRGIGRARVQDRDDAAVRPGRARRRRSHAGSARAEQPARAASSRCRRRRPATRAQ